MIKRRAGFTLIELIVVAAIIGILASIVLANVTVGRERARDAQRVEDLTNVGLAVEVFFEDNGHFPKEGDSKNSEIGIGGGVNDDIDDYLPSVPHDPLGPGDATYYYYYDGEYSCGGEDMAVIFAKRLENTTNSNGASSGCDVSGTIDNESYVIILGKSSG